MNNYAIKENDFNRIDCGMIKLIPSNIFVPFIHQKNDNRSSISISSECSARLECVFLCLFAQSLCLSILKMRFSTYRPL